MGNMCRVLTASAIALATAGPASAVGVLSFTEEGDDVVATLSGSFAFSAGPSNIGVFGPLLSPSAGLLITNESPLASTFAVSGPSSYGTGEPLGGGVAAEGTTGLAIFFNNDFYIDSSYVANTELQGSVTWAGSFETLGLTEGEYVYSIFEADTTEPVLDTFTLRIGDPEVIPLPAAGLLLIGGLGALVMVRRRKG